MSKKFVGDEQVIINLEGLRYVLKEDSRYHGMKELYALEWEYKGSKGRTSYEKVEDRDAMYQKLQAALLNQDK